MAAPATPVLSVADNGDGTGAVATVSGSSAGSTNTVYAAPIAAQGTLAFAAGGSRAGDGAIDLTLANGDYVVFALSVLGGLPSLPSNFVALWATGGASSYGDTFDDLLVADAARVFLSTSEFAIQIQLYPGGHAAGATTIPAIVMLDHEEQFQGPRLDDLHGAVQVRFGRLEISSTVSVAIDKRRELRDAFLINGQIWQAERILGEDALAGLQTIEISREEHVLTRRTRA